MLIFNARDPQYKSPIRAVATDEPVHLRLVVSRDMHCSGCPVGGHQGRRNAGAFTVCFGPECAARRQSIGSCILPPPPRGCIFYHFELDTPGDCTLCATPGGGKGDFLPDGADFQQTVYDKDFQTPAFCGVD